MTINIDVNFSFGNHTVKIPHNLKGKNNCRFSVNKPKKWLVNEERKGKQFFNWLKRSLTLLNTVFSFRILF